FASRACDFLRNGLQLVRFLDHDVAAVGPRHGAVDQQQVVLGVDPHQPYVAHRAPLVAVLAGHAAALGDVTGKLALADRARVAVHLLHAVRRALALEVVPHHDAGGAAALGGADDVEPLDFGQVIDVERLPDCDALDGGAEFADEALGLAIGLGWG